MQERGVYILRGGIVYFRNIEIVYQGVGYYLVKPSSENDNEHTYIRENDMVIISGKNLFDGRVLD